MIRRGSRSAEGRDRRHASHPGRQVTIEGYLTLDDWTTLAKARDRAKRGLPPMMSAAQADLFKARGFMTMSPRGGWVLTDAGKLAVTNWERSRR
jgi:hypothetical protein